MRDVFERYFTKIFGSNGAGAEEFRAVTEEDVHRISAEHRDSVDDDFTIDEVDKALFSMGARKAPGPDGFHALFFQKNWNVVGPGVREECLGVLNRSESIRK